MTQDTIVHSLVGFKGVQIPIIAPINIEFPSLYVANYTSHCGAGKGLSDVIVPETLWGLKVSPACFVHDFMWDEASPTWNDFHISNSVFLRNILSIVECNSASSILKRLRMYRAVTYYNAVDSIGESVFWNIKTRQGNKF